MNRFKQFRWQGIDHLRQKQRGEIVAANVDEARQALFRQGLRQIRLQPNWQWSSKPQQAEISELAMQLAVLLQAALPLKNSLELMRQHCTNVALYQWLDGLIADLERGLRFSQALDNQARYFTYQERQLIKAGEMSGKLAQVCQQIARHKGRALALQRKLQKILLYPLLVLAVSLILTLLLLIFIVPQFAQLYVGHNAALPAFTALLMYLSDGLRQYVIQFLLLAVLSVLFLRLRLNSSRRLHLWKNRLLASMPVLGEIIRLSRLVAFSRSLHLMLQAGVPLNQALQSFLPKIQSWQVNNRPEGDPVLTAEVDYMLQRINRGYAFSQSLGCRLFPPQARQMLRIGEQSGNLTMMLQHIAENYQQRLDHRIDLLSQMLEPLLMVIIGGLIGMIMLGMYLPIFNMGAVLQ
ncbi:type II secretion system F family protein [Necropsobacter rosorum]|uniref:type II secretion system F family protein n=1 Tax=Necropsobacter rosorum TaxID=908285 RepID=UPI000509FD01